MNLKEAVQINTRNAIRWAESTDRTMRDCYGELVDIFGDGLRRESRNRLVEKMMNHSGYVPPNIRVGKKFPPVTAINCDQAVCVYPQNCYRGTYFHEGVHFLAHHGPEKERLIKRDIPLANILGEFVDLTEGHTEVLQALLNGRRLEDIERLATVNPFSFDFYEHSPEEVGEALLTAIKAYAISGREGKRAGIDYVLKLMREANGSI